MSKHEPEDAFLEAVRRDERQKIYAEINALVSTEPLQGNGLDEVAERNGLILALNTIMSMP